MVFVTNMCQLEYCLIFFEKYYRIQKNVFTFGLTLSGVCFS